MSRTAHSTKLTVITAFGALAVGVAAQTGSAAGKVLICHGTASDTNPYVLISVSENAKDTHYIDGVVSGHGPNNHPDFLFKSKYATCQEQLDANDTGGND